MDIVKLSWLQFQFSESVSLMHLLTLGTLGWFGRDCFWTTVTSTSSNHSWFKSFCRFHSKSELLVMAVYPLVGGVSGNISKNRASDTLKGPRAVRLFTCRGRRFSWCLLWQHTFWQHIFLLPQSTVLMFPFSSENISSPFHITSIQIILKYPEIMRLGFGLYMATIKPLYSQDCRRFLLQEILLFRVPHTESQSISSFN